MLTWDPDGKLIQYADSNVVGITYSYDPFGRRIKSVQGSTTNYWFYGAGTGDHPVAEYGTSWQTNVMAGGTLIATVDGGGNATYLGLEHLGTTKQTVNGSGTASSIATYYPYGEQGNAAINPEYQFTNQIRENNALDHFWMRTYASNLGRWLTPDPANLGAVDAANPQSWNRYAYALNSPASLIDPFGLGQEFGCQTLTYGCGLGRMRIGEADANGQLLPSDLSDAVFITTCTLENGDAACFTTLDSNALNAYMNALLTRTLQNASWDQAATLIATGQTPPKSGPQPLSFWDKVGAIIGCFAGMDPEFAKPIGDSPQPADSTDSTNTTEGQGPPSGPNKSGRSVPYGPSPEVPRDVAGGTAYGAGVTQCITNVFTAWPKR